jgi:two-component system chemotaxis sensor kinase CheA
LRNSFSDSHSLVLFHNAPEVLCALPLDTVTRIEHIEPQQVEKIGGRRTMQYHGGLLPLVTLSDAAQVEPIGDGKELAVMIANIRGHEVGLLGAMPVDVVETAAQIDQTTHRQKGVAGSTIIGDKTALIVDLYELVDAAWPEWAAQQSAMRSRARQTLGRVRGAAGRGFRFLPRPGQALPRGGWLSRAGRAGRGSRLGIAAQEPR